MALEQLYLTGRNKIEEALHRIREHEPSEGYTLAFSGGKDSVVLYDLALKSGVKFDAHYCRTGIDPPELVKFIKEYYPDVVFIPPIMTMWQGILSHGLPLRQHRWCCEALKEHAGNNRVILQGVRWQESAMRRRSWPIFKEDRHRGRFGTLHKAFVSPIVDWTSADVWQYIHLNSLPYCCLYDQGFRRLGCLLCPFSTGKELEMQIVRYPKIVEAYRRAANRYYDRRNNSGRPLTSSPSGDAYFEWWLSRN